MSSENPPLPSSAGPEGGSPRAAWAMLLAHWTEFARSALALPEGGEAGLWKASVAPIIGLQALSLAAAEIHLLDPQDRALAMDMGELLVRRHAAELNAIWSGVEMPEKLVALIADARRAVVQAQSLGLEWRLLAEGPVAVPSLAGWGRALLDAGFAGDALVAQPGTLLFAGEPIAFVRPATDSPAPPLADLSAGISLPRQIYRTMRGLRDVTDEIVPFDAPLSAGRPLLAPLIEGGRLVAQPSDDQAQQWLEAQRAALDGHPARISTPPQE